MSQLEPIIIIGGGPVGLTTALAFEKAGIDFVLLEKKDNVAVGEGGDLVLLPPALRALSQLGVLEDIRKASTRLRSLSRVDHKGRDMGEMNWFINYRKRSVHDVPTCKAYANGSAGSDNIPCSYRERSFRKSCSTIFRNMPKGKCI